MTLVRGELIGSLIWLLCAASVAVVGFWYPEAVANRNASPDDRFGFVLLIAIPFEIIGGIISVRAVYRLGVLARHRPGRGSHAVLAAGLLLAALSLSPLLIIGLRFLR
jgi:hypothetical protein